MSEVIYRPIKQNTGLLNGLVMTYVSASSASIGVGVCRDSSDTFDIISLSIRTASLAVSGQDGLDTGVETANTWYALYIIADSTGIVGERALFSLSATAPTLPTGYNVFRRVGWVRNNASSNILAFIQVLSGINRLVSYDLDHTSLQILVAGNSTTFVAVLASSFVPTTSRRIVAHVIFGMNNYNEFANFRPTGSIITTSPYRVVGNSNNATRLAVANIELLTDASQSIDYFVTVSADSLTVAVLGYFDNL